MHDTTIEGFYRHSIETYRRNDDRITIVLMNYADGRRWWVAERPSYRDIGNPNGYELLDDAMRAARSY